MPIVPVQRPQFHLVEGESASPPSTWRPLSDIVAGIVRKVEAQSAAGASIESDLPKAA